MQLKTLKMQFKQTNKLFYGKYQYKVVLVCAGAAWFRSKDWNYTIEQLKKIDLKSTSSITPSYSRFTGTHIKTQEDLDYAFKLQAALSKLSDIDLRVESPWISLYTNTEKNVDKLLKIDKSRIKYVSVPPSNSNLTENSIILPKVNFDYKITIGKTTQNHTTFINWADSNPKIKLTKSCRKQLSSNASWGGSYFYVKGDKNLLLSKMHLGGCISKVESILKA